MSAAAPINCQACGRGVPDGARFCPGCGARIDLAPVTDSWLGSVVGERYRLIERLGSGRTGTIYRAEHVTLHRKAAVKILHPALTTDPAGMDRFSREARVVSELENEHLVNVTDFGKTPGGQLYLAMELLEGETLADVMRRHGRLTVDRTLGLLSQVAEGLMEAHAIGYVHRDLRPSNLFLVHRRGRELVKILGFGVAKMVGGDTASVSGISVADPTYMSPEQARGDLLDGRSDVYSLAVIGYEMLVGAPPFSGPDISRLVRQHLEDAPASPTRLRPDLPVAAEAALLKALAKRPEDRFATMLRFVEALGRPVVQADLGAVRAPAPLQLVTPRAAGQLTRLEVAAAAAAPAMGVPAAAPPAAAAPHASAVVASAVSPRPAVLSTVIVSPNGATPIDARMPTPGPGTMEAPVSQLPHMPSGPIRNLTHRPLDARLSAAEPVTMDGTSQIGQWFATGDAMDRAARESLPAVETTTQLAAAFVRRRRWVLYAGVAVTSLLVTLVIGAVAHRCSGGEQQRPPAAAHN